MPQIPSSLLRAKVTSSMRGLFIEMLRPTQFLLNYAPDGGTTPSKYIEIEVQRGTERIAYDIIAGANGHMNTFDKSTQKIFLPPQYEEKHAVTNMDLFDRAMGSTDIAASAVTAVAQRNAMKMQMCVNQIYRAYEYQMAQALETATITFQNAETVNFARNPALLVAYNTAHNWADNAIDPAVNLASWGTLLRKIGKVSGGVIDIIFGTDAWLKFTGNTKVRERADVRRIEQERIVAPTFNMDGAMFHGIYSDGLHNYRLFTYDQWFMDKNDVLQPYINPKKIYMIAPGTHATVEYAGVPQLVDETRPLEFGKFRFSDYIDEEKQAHMYRVQSAGLVVMNMVDKFLTAQVLS